MKSFIAGVKTKAEEVKVVTSSAKNVTDGGDKMADGLTTMLGDKNPNSTKPATDSTAKPAANTKKDEGNEKSANQNITINVQPNGNASSPKKEENEDENEFAFPCRQFAKALQEISAKNSKLAKNKKREIEDLLEAALEEIKSTDK